MREIDAQIIKENIKTLFQKSCCILDEQTNQELNKRCQASKGLEKSIFSQIVENAKIAKNEFIPICQDTGISIVFLEIGQDVHINGDLNEAINMGVKEAYMQGYLRKSVVSHPLDRINTNDNTPAIIHTRIVNGDKIKITVAPKGAGSENMSKLKMLNPSDGYQGVKDFVINSIVEAGGRPCPPIIVGIGIGGDFEKSALLAKEALLRPLDDITLDPIARRLEDELFIAINETNIGAMGLGGKNTCLAVKVNCYPCHIASLPVAINIGCHVNRHFEVIL